MEQDIFAKLAELGGETVNEAIPGDQAPAEEPVIETPVPSEPVQTRDEAIDEAAAKASQDVGDLLEDMPSEALTVPTEELTEPIPSGENTIPVDEAVAGAEEHGQAIDPAIIDLLNDLELQRQQAEQDVTEHLASFGALARVVEMANGEEDGYQKSAAHLLDAMLEDEEMYRESIEKVATNLYATEEDLDALYQYDAAEYIASVLETHLSPSLEKQANELDPDAETGDTFRGKARQAVDGFVEKVNRLKHINQEIAGLNSQLDEAKAVVSQTIPTGTPEAIKAAQQRMNEVYGVATDLANAENFRAKGYGLAALGVGGLAGGGYLAGRALFQNKEETSLNGVNPDDTLNAGTDTFTTENGGNYKMANTVFMDEILKLAGANFLLSNALDPNAGEEINKIASDEFDRIASLARADLDFEFVKTALECIDETTLREIVAGVHTQELLEKTAHFAQLDLLSADELQKYAGAGSVSAKGAAGALRDASEKVENILIQAKEEAQGEGREYAGEGGKLGGALVNDMGGYNVLQDPASYEIEQTASFDDIEAAISLMKQASAAYNDAAAYVSKAFGN